jgi:hypothetical protein
MALRPTLRSGAGLPAKARVLPRKLILIHVFNTEMGLSTCGVDKSVDGFRMKPAKRVRAPSARLLVKNLPDKNSLHIQLVGEGLRSSERRPS